MRNLCSALALTVCLTGATGAWAKGPWAEMAEGDLKAIRQLLQENHPGPVDPKNRFFAEWLEKGYQPAVARAEAAQTFSDYKRAIRFYTNGFHDGHIAVLPTVDTVRPFAPGFTVSRDAEGRYRVIKASSNAGVEDGAEILSCNGVTVDSMMRERVEPYYWNTAIPHQRNRLYGYLFLFDPDEEAARPKSCLFRVNGQDMEVSLRWRPISQDEARALTHTWPPAPEAPSLHKVGDIWWVSLPSFYYPDDPKPITDLITAIKAQAEELRNATVVFDMRGNGGGRSVWGLNIAAAVWGDGAVEYVVNRFDTSHDWRASPANLANAEATLERFRRQGQDTRYYERVRAAISKAIAEKRELAKLNHKPEPPSGPAPASLFRGRAYLLTDGACASACLDFADVMRRLHGVTQIGDPTSADAIYIDNTIKVLPSGLSSFAYSMKVYRNRIRGHNVWYEPQIRWPGGEMTNEAVTKWVTSLP